MTQDEEGQVLWSKRASKEKRNQQRKMPWLVKLIKTKLMILKLNS